MYSIAWSFSHRVFRFLARTGQVTAPTFSLSKNPTMELREFLLGNESASTTAISSDVASFNPTFCDPAALPKFLSLLISFNFRYFSRRDSTICWVLSVEQSFTTITSLILLYSILKIWFIASSMENSVFLKVDF